MMKKTKILKILGYSVFVLNIVLMFVLLVKKNISEDELSCSESELLKMERTLEDTKEMVRYDYSTNCFEYNEFTNVFNEKVSALDEGQEIVLMNVSFGSIVRGLKYINDNFGHYYGNMAVKRFSDIIKEVYHEDGFIHGYAGGSNFFVISTDITDRDILMQKGELFKEKWHDTPFIIEGLDAELDSLSFYISMISIHDRDAQLKDMRSELSKSKDNMRNKANYGVCFIK